MTEQFKLVTNAQESKIFKSNVTTIKVNCSNNFPRPNSVEITYTSLEQSENFTIYTLSAKITLQITHSDWSNLVTHTAWLQWTIVRVAITLPVRLIFYHHSLVHSKSTNNFSV